MAKITWKKTQKINPKSDDELVKKKREEINNILSENKADIESGKIIVFFLDECHLLHGDINGYVWGRSDIRIEVPITIKKIDKLILAHSIIKPNNSMFKAMNLAMENQQLNL